jgi:xanthine/uracil permease
VRRRDDYAELSVQLLGSSLETLISTNLKNTVMRIPILLAVLFAFTLATTAVIAPIDDVYCSDYIASAGSGFLAPWEL